jgi:cobalt-precorrin 5A hydrolase
MLTMSKPEAVHVAGLGCQRGCTADALLSLMTACLQRHGLTIENLSALASINLKGREPGLLALAQQLDLPVHFFSARQLAEHASHLSHRSQTAFEHTGCYGVAESAALALASQTGVAQLLITRQKSAQATFALAIAFAPGE